MTAVHFLLGLVWARRRPWLRGMGSLAATQLGRWPGADLPRPGLPSAAGRLPRELLLGVCPGFVYRLLARGPSFPRSSARRICDLRRLERWPLCRGATEPALLRWPERRELRALRLLSHWVVWCMCLRRRVRVCFRMVRSLPVRWRHRGARRLPLVTASGHFLYAQIFSLQRRPGHAWRGWLGGKT